MTPNPDTKQQPAATARTREEWEEKLRALLFLENDLVLSKANREDTPPGIYAEWKQEKVQQFDRLKLELLDALSRPAPPQALHDSPIIDRDGNEISIGEAEAMGPPTFDPAPPQSREQVKADAPMPSYTAAHHGCPDCRKAWSDAEAEHEAGGSPQSPPAFCTHGYVYHQLSGAASPVPPSAGEQCAHERLDEDGICRTCGKDCRGIGA